MAEDDNQLEFDLDDLTIGDLEDFEDKTGQPLMGMFASVDGDGGVDLDLTKITAATLKALAWIAKRKKDPDVPYESIRDVKISDLSMGGSDPS